MPPIRWLGDVIPKERLKELEPSLAEVEVISRPSAPLCLTCRGGRMLCGKIRCPLILKAQSLVKKRALMDSLRIEGSTPPAVFVGRVGYPQVYIGPMVPPYHGSTEILDTPEMWLGKPVEEIVDYRYSLIRGKVRAHVNDASFRSRVLDTLQELAMSLRSVESEVELWKKPKGVLTLSDEVQPFGPSAPLKSFKAGSISVDRRIEKAYYDKDLKAVDAVWALYKDGVLITRIQRTFSLGMFGSTRRLVPTRWSITAVDSIISSCLIEQLKGFDTIDEYRVYKFKSLGSIYVAILMPEKWSFEWIEAWFPGTTWNPEKGSKPALMGDYEGYRGRSEYPDIGGCYFSARLAVAEALMRERRQSSALLMREIHPEHVLPLGVWSVRESIRAMLSKPPELYDGFERALHEAMKALTIPLREWIVHSRIIRRARFQRRITEFVK
ncbi:MAG: Nre family DNA repair protein [Nitrososphaerota archaeon]